MVLGYANLKNMCKYISSLEIRKWIREKVHVQVGMNNGESGSERLQDHVRADVHLSLELLGAVHAAPVRRLVLRVVIAKQ
jgi:hypothetical protein